MTESALTPEIATLASRVFQLVIENRLTLARDAIEEELANRELPTEDMLFILEAYHAAGLPKVIKITPPRRHHMRVRWKEHPDKEWWTAFFARVKRSSFLTGGAKDRPWKATFDWLMLPANLIKVTEGNYDNRVQTSRYDANDEAAFRMSAPRG